MKIATLTRLMNDHGTRPRIKVMKRMRDYSLLVYEGPPENIDNETATLQVLSFTVLGKGFMEINAK